MADRTGARRQVAYEISGTAKNVSVPYANAQGMVEHQETIQLPFTTSFLAPSAMVVSIVAKNGGKSGTIPCTFLIEGKVIETNTSEGADTRAKCGGNVR